MPPEVDPELAAALERLPEPPLELEAQRRAHLEATPIVSGDGPDVARQVDHAVDGPGGHVPVRLYVPEADAPPPVLVYLHGGGWLMGSRASYDPTCRALAVASGVAVLSVEYRLAPEDPFPAAVEDAMAVLAWTAEEAGGLGVDAARLAVGGDSAGGQPAAPRPRPPRGARRAPPALPPPLFPAARPRRAPGPPHQICG